LENYFRLFEAAREEIQNGRAGCEVDFRDSGRLNPVGVFVTLADGLAKVTSLGNSVDFDISDA
jgi:hypothetical protein